MAIQTRVFDYDPLFDVLRLWHYDDQTDQATIETRQGMHDRYDGVADLATAERNQTSRKTPYNDGAHRVARIPMVIYEELMRLGITRDPKAMKKWLNDPDNRVFRTREGVV